MHNVVPAGRDLGEFHRWYGLDADVRAGICAKLDLDVWGGMIWGALVLGEVGLDVCGGQLGSGQEVSIVGHRRGLLVG